MCSKVWLTPHLYASIGPFGSCSVVFSKTSLLKNSAALHVKAVCRVLVTRSPTAMQKKKKDSKNRKLERKMMLEILCTATKICSSDHRSQRYYIIQIPYLLTFNAEE